ncbi:response regulator transcription factor [Geodermatophilus sp. SYSU D01176]
MSEIRVLLGDGHRSFVEALEMRLGAEPGLRVIAAVVKPSEVVPAARSRGVDVAVLATDGAGDFLALGPEIRAACPQAGLVGVSGGEDVATVAYAIRQGFRGWVPKDVGIAALVDVIHAVRRGETRIPPLLLTQLLDQLLREEQDRNQAELPFRSLTAREREVLRAMSTGASRQEIAVQLAISPNTVRTHMQSILAKLDVHTSLAAVMLARRAGFG